MACSEYDEKDMAEKPELLLTRVRLPLRSAIGRTLSAFSLLR